MMDAASPIGFPHAIAALSSPQLVVAGIGVGVCSSVIPYISDQLAMSRLPRATFAVMLALLPAIATLVGAVVLAQIPSLRDLAGIALVMAGVCATVSVKLCMAAGLMPLLAVNVMA